ncbi:MAG: LLM class flavin-dependent oxidoreductase, partial [Burkholderiales bacterium]|nr:LLM class flavin-dependent oxidoreductase [Burkholderiales bacterium]
AAAVAAGRAPDALRIYAQALIITAPTSTAARAKYADYLSYIDTEAALTLLSGWTGIDFSRYHPDSVIEYLDNDAGRTALASFTTADPNRQWTVGEAARFIGLGGRGPVLVGDPQEVTDQLIAWQDETGIDGFNLAYAVAPGSFADVVELIVPELTRRGRYPDATPKTSLRNRLFGQGDRLPSTHIGRQFPFGGSAPATAPSAHDSRVPA